MKKCCDNTEKYFIEFRKRDDNELIWLVCEEHFQNEEFRKKLEKQEQQKAKEKQKELEQKLALKLEKEKEAHEKQLEKIKSDAEKKQKENLSFHLDAPIPLHLAH